MNLLDRLFGSDTHDDDSGDSAEGTSSADGDSTRRRQSAAGPTEGRGPAAANTNRYQNAFRNYEHTRLPAASDPATIVEEALDNEPNPNPRGRAFTARVSRTRAHPLLGVVNELDVRLTNPEPVLIAIPYDDAALRTVAEAFSTTIAVAPDREEHVEIVREFLPLLFRPGVTTGPIGSVRLIRDFDVEGADPTSEAVLGTLRERRGRPLHGAVTHCESEYLAYAAPAAFHDITRSALAHRGEVIGGLPSTGPNVHIAGWTFMDIDTWFGPTDSLPSPVETAEPSDSRADDGSGADRDGTEMPDAATPAETGAVPTAALHWIDWGDDGVDVHTWHN